MNRDVVLSIGLGISCLAILRVFFELPGELMAGVAFYTVLMTSGQYFIRINEIISYERWVIPAKLVGKSIIAGSVALTILVVFWISTRDQHFVEKTAEILTLIALGISLTSISIYNK